MKAEWPDLQYKRGQSLDGALVLQFTIAEKLRPHMSTISQGLFPFRRDSMRFRTGLIYGLIDHHTKEAL